MPVTNGTPTQEHDKVRDDDADDDDGDDDGTDDGDDDDDDDDDDNDDEPSCYSLTHWVSWPFSVWPVFSGG